MANEQEAQVGKVVQVIGAVVDIAFDNDDNLPAIYNAIHVKDDNSSVPVDVICETMQHLGDGVLLVVPYYDAVCVCLLRAAGRE